MRCSDKPVPHIQMCSGREDSIKIIPPVSILKAETQAKIKIEL